MHRRGTWGTLPLVLALVATAAGCDGSPQPMGGDPSVGASTPRVALSPSAPNVILVVTDDQTWSSMRGDPPAMPWLTSSLDGAGWTKFTNAIVSTPMCCPSRATILTGRYARRTGVETNADGDVLHDADTIAVRLHDAGYVTAMIGKYLNGYPWDGRPLVPPGWDRWFAKLNVTQATTYYGYDIVDGERRSTVADAPEGYATDRLAAEAVRFVDRAPPDRPFFLYLAPSAPHAPATPAPRHAGAPRIAHRPVTVARIDRLNAVAGGPRWIDRLPPLDAAAVAELDAARSRERLALRAVDDALRRLWRLVAARGELDRTVWLILSDNGYSYGHRRWVGKGCPWESCLRVPFVAHVPGTRGGSVDSLVANIDVAPTIAELAGVPAGDVDGRSVLPLVQRRDTWARRAVFIDWAGRDDVPPWAGVRLEDAVFIRHDDGTEELYDLRDDPGQRRNLATRPTAAGLRERAERELARSLAALGGDG